MPKDKKFSTFISYCESLAAQHVAIQHTAGNKHFFRLEIEEVFTTLPGDMNFPAFILEGYSYGFKDAKSDNPIKVRTSGIILLDHVSDPGDFNRIHQVWDELEEIGDDIFARIKADKKNPLLPAVYDFNLESVQASLLQMEMGNNYGIRYTFELDSAMQMDVDPEKWIEA